MAGTRTIGQVAGHEINLEIEDVLDKIKIKIFISRLAAAPSLPELVLRLQWMSEIKTSKNRNVRKLDRSSCWKTAQIPML